MVPEALKGCGLGSYAFSRLIEWGKHEQPTYRVAKLKLAEGDAQTNETRDQRNGFYKKHGFEFSFLDQDHKTGYCFAESLAQLQSGINSDKVSPVDLYEEMPNLLISNEHLTKENIQKKAAFENCYSQKQKLANEKSRLWLAMIAVAIIALILKYYHLN